jgi:uncharacterized protein YqeY
VRDELRAALTHARKRRDKVAVSAYRSALAAMDNAEAADLSAAPAESIGEHIAGGVAGLGAGEVSRRELTTAELGEVLQREIDDRRANADIYERAGQRAEADTLRAEAAVIDDFRAAGASDQV